MKFQTFFAFALIGLISSVVPATASLDKPTSLDKLHDTIQSYCKSNKDINTVRVFIDLTATEKPPVVRKVDVEVECNKFGSIDSYINTAGKVTLYKDNLLFSTYLDTILIQRISVDAKQSAYSGLINGGVVNRILLDQETKRIIVIPGAIIIR
jgi:hypothetical protein